MAPLIVAVHARPLLVREGIAGILHAHPGIAVDCATGSWSDFVAACREQHVDTAVAVVEPGTEDAAAERLESLTTARPDLRVVAITDPTCAPSLGPGNGTGNGNGNPGLVTVSRAEPVEELLGALGRTNGRAEASGTSLTRREQQVADLAASGMSSAEIGTRLGISPRTVENHTRRIYAKLNVQSRAHLAAVMAKNVAEWAV